jgi:DNA helicase II / ATP-dependent DNA helicase PcrA
MPADLATGHQADIEEERRLLYVAMTRARDTLSLWVPQRFHVTQQRQWGDRHMHALRSRFISDEMLGLYELVTPQSGAQAGPQSASTDDKNAAPLLDLAGAFRTAWANGPDHGPDRGSDCEAC